MLTQALAELAPFLVAALVLLAAHRNVSDGTAPFALSAEDSDAAVTIAILYGMHM